MSELIICTAIALSLPISYAVKDVVKCFRALKEELSK